MYSELVISIILCLQFLSDLNIFRMEIENAVTTPCNSHQLRNGNTIRSESRNVTTQPVETDKRKSEVIAFVVNAGVNVTANNLISKCKKEVSLSEVFALFN